jgi:hypothetical protein
MQDSSLDFRGTDGVKNVINCVRNYFGFFCDFYYTKPDFFLMTILVVDDHELFGSSLIVALKSKGFHDSIFLEEPTRSL